jgi:hypothetical protein
LREVDEKHGGKPGPADDPPPSGNGADWDAFKRGFRDYVARAGRGRVPAGHA